MMQPTLVILAAGKGSRMGSDLPKVLHPLGGVPLLVHAMAASGALEAGRVIVVAGHGAEDVTRAVHHHMPEAEVVVQPEQLGTGHAVAQTLDHLPEHGDVVVLYGDTPFLRPDTLQALLDARASADLVVLGFQAADPGRYGRVIADGSQITRIVEWKDATEAERAVTLCNSGVVCASCDLLRDLVPRIGNDNAAGEYYLTDLVSMARADGRAVGLVECPEAETLGINTRAELAAAEAAFQRRARATAIDDGVMFADPDTVYLSFDTVIGRDARIGPFVVFGPGVSVESDAEILSFCHLEGCHVAAGARVGPFARLRPGTELGADAHVGNFVELKNAILETGVKIGHLSYLGDAEVGEATNIGAGTITCNYDGVGKHRTHIGAGAFIGSDTILVAPVRVGNGAMTAAGSVITRDVEEDALGVARARQDNRPGFVARFVKRLRDARVAGRA
jgi:bifunctional UDP-N-acetylglucosamine pyrophosphorylase/glucosamine-1-phosphate N-acetyltransferase